MEMTKTWRWYGPHDEVQFSDIKQAGVYQIVTSLSHIPYGSVWPKEDILERKALLEANGLHWKVVESVPIHEDIKTQSGNFRQYIQNYKESIRNLAACGIKIICYNFMPVMDWTRTNVHYELENGSKTLHFNYMEMAAFDLFILKRPKAKETYTTEMQHKASNYFKALTSDEIEALTQVLIANLPGTDEKYSLDEFKAVLKKYEAIDAEKLKDHLNYFLSEIIPVAESCGVNMCIHPDDPPFDLLGLPRVVSTEKDLSDLLKAVDSPNNGLTFCTGSLGVREDNNLNEMFKRFSHRVHFLHLRSTLRTPDGNFHEAPHLAGDVDMYSIIKLIVEEQIRRKEEGREDVQIPMRPDHGHQMMDDLHKSFYPGYSCIGRMKGLAELSGVEYAVRSSMNLS